MTPITKGSNCCPRTVYSDPVDWNTASTTSSGTARTYLHYLGLVDYPYYIHNKTQPTSYRVHSIPLDKAQQTGLLILWRLGHEPPDRVYFLSWPY